MSAFDVYIARFSVQAQCLKLTCCVVLLQDVQRFAHVATPVCCSLVFDVDGDSWMAGVLSAVY